MNFSKPSVGLFLLFFGLHGCATHTAMQDATQSMQEGHQAAAKVIRQLKQRDEALVDGYNLAIAELKQQSHNSLMAAYQAELTALYQLKAKLLGDILILTRDYAAACQALIENAGKSTDPSITQAERLASQLHKASLENRQDKVLALHAAKAAADYFGRIAKQQTTGTDALSRCNRLLPEQAHKASRRLEQEAIAHEKALASLFQEAQEDIASLSPLTGPAPAFELLGEWNQSNQQGLSNMQLYLHMSHPLSRQGFVARAFKGGKQAAVAALNSEILLPVSLSVENMSNSVRQKLSAFQRRAQTRFGEVVGSMETIVTEFEQGASQAVGS